jgi:hypothetical protein
MSYCFLSGHIVCVIEIYFVVVDAMFLYFSWLMHGCLHMDSPKEHAVYFGSMQLQDGHFTSAVAIAAWSLILGSCIFWHFPLFLLPLGYFPLFRLPPRFFLLMCIDRSLTKD